MQCPTCGKKVSRRQETCSYCGGLVTPASLARGESSPASRSEERRGLFSSPPASADAELPEPEEIEPGEEREPFPERPLPMPAPGPALPRPRIPSLIRFLFPLLVLLIPLFRFLARDSSLSPRGLSAPVLREALFCEEIAEGLPVNPKAVFSLRQDRRVFLYGRWRGSRGNHVYSLRWYTPSGTLQITSSSVVIYPAGNRNFASTSFLPLKPGMSLGQWRVEIYLDRELRARLSFELRE